MNWPQQQPPMQPFPGQPAPQQQAFPQQQITYQPGQAGGHGVLPAPMPGAPAPVNPAAVAAGAQANSFAQMLMAPARQRRNREKPADGTHVVQFTLETKMDTSQQNMQPYLLVSYMVIESTVPQMVNKSYACPMTLNSRGAVQSLAEMAKTIFGQQYVGQLAAQNVAPYQIAQLLSQYLVNPQTKQGLFCLLNTWRGRPKPAAPGQPPPSYDEAFVNHDWLMAQQAVFTLEQARAAGHRINAPMPPVVQGGASWAPVPTVPAQMVPQAQPMTPFQQPGAPFAPQPQAQPMMAPPQAPAPFAPPAPAGFPPPANVVPQAPQQMAPPPAAFIPGGLPPLPGQRQ